MVSVLFVAVVVVQILLVVFQPSDERICLAGDLVITEAYYKEAKGCNKDCQPLSGDSEQHCVQKDTVCRQSVSHGDLVETYSRCLNDNSPFSCTLPTGRIVLGVAKCPEGSVYQPCASFEGHFNELTWVKSERFPLNSTCQCFLTSSQPHQFRFTSVNIFHKASEVQTPSITIFEKNLGLLYEVKDQPYPIIDRLRNATSVVISFRYSSGQQEFVRQSLSVQAHHTFHVQCGDAIISTSTVSVNDETTSHLYPTMKNENGGDWRLTDAVITCITVLVLMLVLVLVLGGLLIVFWWRRRTRERQDSVCKSVIQPSSSIRNEPLSSADTHRAMQPGVSASHDVIISPSSSSGLHYDAAKVTRELTAHVQDDVSAMAGGSAVGVHYDVARMTGESTAGDHYDVAKMAGESITGGHYDVAKMIGQSTVCLHDDVASVEGEPTAALHYAVTRLAGGCTLVADPNQNGHREADTDEYCTLIRDGNQAQRLAETTPGDGAAIYDHTQKDTIYHSLQRGPQRKIVVDNIYDTTSSTAASATKNNP